MSENITPPIILHILYGGGGGFKSVKVSNKKDPQFVTQTTKKTTSSFEKILFLRESARKKHFAVKIDYEILQLLK